MCTSLLLLLYCRDTILPFYISTFGDSSSLSAVTPRSLLEGRFAAFCSTSASRSPIRASLRS